MVLSYVAACAAASILVGIHSSILVFAGPTTAFGTLIGMTFFGFIFTAIVALPMFVLLRGLLHFAKRDDVWSFVVAGAGTAYGTASVVFWPDSLELFLKYPPNPILAIAGAAGGLAAWRTETYLFRESLRQGSKT